MNELFPGLTVCTQCSFRLTRNSDLFVDEEEMTNLRSALSDELGQRPWGHGVRLEMTADISPEVAERLRKEFDLNEEDCYRVHGSVNLGRYAKIIELVERPDLLFPPFTPSQPTALQKDDLFSVIAAGDVLLHHPYESFNPVKDFLRSAARDPQVVSIKQTIYRTGADSVLMESLMEAARAGKEVTVVLELMARFDEETNINWAAKLEEVGVHVVYGVVGHKTHAKLALVLRREAEGLRRYAHLGTGNYHPRTARLYEDFGLFTADEEICADVHEVFRRLTGLGTAGGLKALLQAPFRLHGTLLQAIQRETEAAQAGRKARIIAKMNALLEERIIEALYEASCAGVQIDLIVRGGGTLPGAQPHLLLLGRRQGKALAGLGRLDGAQLLPPRRSGLPAEGRHPQAPRHRGRTAELPAARHGRVEDGQQRRLPRRRRAALARARRPAAAAAKAHHPGKLKVSDRKAPIPTGAIPTGAAHSGRCLPPRRPAAAGVLIRVFPSEGAVPDIG